MQWLLNQINHYFILIRKTIYDIKCLEILIKFLDDLVMNMDKIALFSIIILASGVFMARTTRADMKTRPGLTVKNGKLYKDGNIYLGIGVNYGENCYYVFM
jgi:hypothetical protein